MKQAFIESGIENLETFLIDTLGLANLIQDKFSYMPKASICNADVLNALKDYPEAAKYCSIHGFMHSAVEVYCDRIADALKWLREIIYADDPDSPINDDE